MATAGDMLLRAQFPGDPPRRKEVLLLSDGLPNLPPGNGPRRTVATARVLEERGVDVHMFPLGAAAIVNAPFFEFMDEYTGSAHTKVGLAGEVIEKLAELRLDRIVKLEVENRTTGEPGRALRLFADGSFDAVVALAAGPNEIAFRAETKSGSRALQIRTLRHSPETVATSEAAARQRSAIEAFAERLEQRRAETELLVDLEKAATHAEQLERRLRIEAAEVAPDN